MELERCPYHLQHSNFQDHCYFIFLYAVSTHRRFLCLQIDFYRSKIFIEELSLAYLPFLELLDLIHLISRVNCFRSLYFDYVGFIIYCYFISLELYLFLLLFNQLTNLLYCLKFFFGNKYYLIHVTIKSLFRNDPYWPRSSLIIFTLVNFCSIV